MNLNERMNAVSGLNLPEYELIDVKELSDINSAGLLLRHKKSGARVVVISNDDNNKVFSIGFKTPPYNDTGLQHIIEHSTLCGSRKYPVKDPFVELCKGSLNTFLNAMTYADKTIYPVASCNDADFKNIMDVYMDAVFYPNMYNNKKIFMQEGWHHELDSKDGDITYNGVVYNEMKGVYSSLMMCCPDLHPFHFSQIQLTGLNQVETQTIFQNFLMRSFWTIIIGSTILSIVIYTFMVIWISGNVLNILTGNTLKTLMQQRLWWILLLNSRSHLKK